MIRALTLVALVLPTAACTWVHMAPGASTVKVVPAAPSGCEQRGVISVSVASKVALYRRDPLKVQDELETLARNEAPGVGADTISPQAPPLDGDQKFTAWRCGR